MHPQSDASDTDFDLEHVRRMLRQQGYTIPEAELVEVTASLNALIEGLTANAEQYGPLLEEPWAGLVDYLEDIDDLEDDDAR